MCNGRHHGKIIIQAFYNSINLERQLNPKHEKCKPIDLLFKGDAQVIYRWGKSTLASITLNEHPPSWQEFEDTGIMKPSWSDSKYDYCCKIS